VLLLALSSGHKVGLALAVLVFAGFSLVVSMIVPRRLPAFLAVSFVLFFGMMAAVVIFGAE
jgi:hypothetical protein